MNFYIKEYGSIKYIQKKFPSIVLTTDDWNDWFGAETLFHAKYYKTEDSFPINLGDIKIMTTNEKCTRKVIPEHFTRLDKTYCSLGQNLNYYEKINNLDDKDKKDILSGLRDVATSSNILSLFKQNNTFKNSLLRFSEAEKALKEARKYFGGSISKTLKFSYECQLESASAPHIVKLDFEEDFLPYRINAFVGKNATGKTKVLTELSSSLSGAKRSKSSFLPERPSFSKIITISYSAFDELYKPFEDISNIEHSNKDERKEESKLFSYKYCGLRNKQGVLSLKELEHQFIEAFESVKERGREDEWIKIMRNVFEEEHLELIHNIKSSQSSYSLSNLLSSGQNILLSTITDVIANIEVDSLLLFDEPEIHLHPNAIANFMRMFYEILERFDSYAIISTHSPIILQEVPSKYISVFSRIDNIPLINLPSLECFGENISTITNDIFDVREHESNYKTYLKYMANRMSKDEIIDLFEDELSFNALTFLNAIYKRKDVE